MTTERTIETVQAELADARRRGHKAHADRLLGELTTLRYPEGLKRAKAIKRHPSGYNPDAGMRLSPFATAEQQQEFRDELANRLQAREEERANSPIAGTAPPPFDAELERDYRAAKNNVISLTEWARRAER